MLNLMVCQVKGRVSRQGEDYLIPPLGLDRAWAQNRKKKNPRPGKPGRGF